MNKNDMVKFIDKQKREIYLENEGDLIRAYHGDQFIGDFQLRIEELALGGEAVHADTINLKDGYRSAGIGTEMVRQAFEHHGQKIIPPDTYYPEKENRNSMSQEGRRLTEACQRRGYVGPFQDQLPDPTDPGEE